MQQLSSCFSNRTCLHVALVSLYHKSLCIFMTSSFIMLWYHVNYIHLGCIMSCQCFYFIRPYNNFYDVFYDILCDVISENLPPWNSHAGLKWHLHPVTFQGHVDQPHRNVLRLVEQTQVSMVTVLQKRPGWASYRSCLPFIGLKPVFQELQIMKQVLVWMLEWNLKLQHSQNKQLTVCDSIPERHESFPHLQGRLGAVQNSVANIHHIS